MKEISTSTQNKISMETAQYMSSAMDDIFDILKGFYTGYGAVLKTTSVETAIRQQWIYELIGSKVNEDMLRTGMSRAKAHSLEDKFCKWPSIMDFISWCHGIPSPDGAYFETKRNCHDLAEWEPSHAIVALAGKHVGFHQILNSDNEKHFKTEYIRFFCELISRVLAGETFIYTKLEKPVAIEEKKLTPEEITRNRAKLSELIDSIPGSEAKKEEPRLMSEEDKQKRMAEMRAKAEAWKASRGDK